MSNIQTITVSGAPPVGGSFTEPISISGNIYQIVEIINISIELLSGVFNATVTFQRRFSDSDTWKDIVDFTDEMEWGYSESDRTVQYRIGIKQGNWVSGEIKLRLSRG